MNLFKTFSIKRLVAKTLGVTTFLTPLLYSSAAFAQPRNYAFYDIVNHWAVGCIEGVGADGLMKGYLDDSFRPDGTMTRAEFAAVMIKAFPNAPTVRSAPNFSDVPQGFWGRAAIAQAYERGFLAGYPGNLFKPAQPISRAQAMVIIANTQAIASANIPTASNEAVLNQYFQDATSIPSYARSAIAQATRRRLVVNYPNANRLRPNASITRAEATALLCRLNEDGSDARHDVDAAYVAAFGGKIDTAGVPMAQTAKRPEPVLLQSFESGTSGILLREAIALGEQLFFIDSSGTAPKLWRTDGTTAGTQLVKALVFNPEEGGAVGSDRARFVGIGEARLWLMTGGGDRSFDLRAGLWRTDGSAEGTQAIAALSPVFAEAIAPAEQIETGWYPTPALNNRIPFVIRTPSEAQLWMTDGNSDAGTEQLATFASPPVNQQRDWLQQFATTDDYLFFIAALGSGETAAKESTALWRTDGTPEGTMALQPLGDVSNGLVRSWQNRVYFTASTPETGQELWVSNGTPAGTQLLLKDIYPGAESSAASIVGRTETTVFMLANAAEGLGLWATAGTPESTRLVKQLSSQSQRIDDAIYVESEGRLFFSAPTQPPASGSSAGSLSELWVTDGTESGTRSVGKRLSSHLIGATAFKGRLFFSERGLGGNELWVSDGTALGTYQLLDITPGTTTILAPCAPPPPEFTGESSCPPPFNSPNSTSPKSLTVQGDFLYFMASGGRLFRTDGTGQGIELVKALDSREGLPSDIVALGQQILFVTYGDRPQLWTLP
ncbi:MAG: S-layer homology domain-containing protein [Phormidesmis sp.]